MAAWVLLAGLPAGGQQSKASPQPAGEARPNIILISVDTLRADRLQMNSPGAPATPNIDKLLQGGTGFSQETSLVPLTLPSHAAMLTSTYPFVNGVQDNGERLAPGAVTLASALRGQGYQTAAILGSFVLDRRFGLDQGFDFYDSPEAGLNNGSSDPGDIKRKGEDVVKAGESWLSAHKGRPFFLFLHLYDLHTPYNLSPDEVAKYGKGYDGELRYIDHAIGELWSYLTAHDLVNSSLIVFTSDHGEGLGDHGETTHGFFVYQSTLHVPLILHWPVGVPPLPARVDAPASLLDLAPTILDAVHLEAPKEMEGASMLGAGATQRDIFSESVYPERHFDASALYALRRGHYKYIEAPRPEFYDLSQDPGENNNLYGSKGAVASAYRERLNKLRQSYQAHVPSKDNTLSPEAIERLHALGYLTGSKPATKNAAQLADPKDRITAYEDYGRAISLASLGHLEQANTMLAGILKQDPELTDVRLALGLNEQRMGRDAEAVEQFRMVLTADPESAIAHLDAGLSYYNLKQFDQAQKELEAALAISPGYTKAEILLGKTLAQKGDLEGSRAQFQHVLGEDANNYEAHDGLGTLNAMRGDWKASEQELQAALAIEPKAAETHNTLGSVYMRTGDTGRARGEFEEAVRLKPGYAAAHYNLGIALAALRDMAGARREFEEALRADPNFLPAREALQRIPKSP